MLFSATGSFRMTTFCVAICLGGVVHYLAGDHSTRALVVFVGGAIAVACLAPLVWRRRAETDWLFAACMLCIAGFYGFDGVAQLVLLLAALVLGVALGLRARRRHRRLAT